MQLSKLVLSGTVVAMLAATGPEVVAQSKRRPRPSQDTENVKRARQHYKNGLQFFTTEEYRPALAEFIRSNQLHPHSTTLYNIGVCFAALRQYLEALSSFRLALETPPTLPPAKRKAAQAEIARLERLIATIKIQLNVPEARLKIGEQVQKVHPGQTLRIPAGVYEIALSAPLCADQKLRLTLPGGETTVLQLNLTKLAYVRIETGSQRGAQVLIDGQPAGHTPFRNRVSPGRHSVRVVHPDRLSWAGDVSATPGRTLRISLKLATPSKKKHPIWFWSAAGTAAALGVVALGLGLKANAVQSDYDRVVDLIQSGAYPTGCDLSCLQSRGRSMQSDLRHYALATNVVAGFAAAAAVTAATLAFFTQFRKPEASRASMSYAIAPVWGPGPDTVARGAALVATGRFP